MFRVPVGTEPQALSIEPEFEVDGQVVSAPEGTTIELTNDHPEYVSIAPDADGVLGHYIATLETAETVNGQPDIASVTGVVKKADGAPYPMPIAFQVMLTSDPTLRAVKVRLGKFPDE